MSNDYRRSRYIPGFIRIWRGKAREERFIEAWTNPPNPPDWFADVRKASKEEDFSGVDAFFICKDQTEIPVQIKGTYAGIEDYLRAHPISEKNVVLLQIQAIMSLEEIRLLSLFALRAYFSREPQKTALPETSKTA
ncbi:MAG TPA: hypothetical protein VIR98_00945 [Candidatus Paceibacterota bacterium]|jgi:hypothetical protein